MGPASRALQKGFIVGTLRRSQDPTCFRSPMAPFSQIHASLQHNSDCLPPCLLFAGLNPVRMAAVPSREISSVLPQLGCCRKISWTTCRIPAPLCD